MAMMLPDGWKVCVDRTSGRKWYFNTLTSERSWLPPAPPSPVHVGSSSDEIEEVHAQPQSGARARGRRGRRPQSLQDHGFVAAPKSPVKEDENGALVHEVDIVEVKEPETPKAIDITVEVDTLRKADLLDLMHKYNVPIENPLGRRRGATVGALRGQLKKYFRSLHEAQGTAYFESKCFEFEKAEMDRERKLKPKPKTPRCLPVANGAKAKAKKSMTSKYANKKKTYTVDPKRIIAMYPNEGFYIQDNKLFCKCKLQELKGTKATVTNHMKTKRHMRAKEKRAASKKEQATLQAAVSAVETKIDDATKTFRARTVRAFLIAGIPVNKLKTLKPFVQDETGKSIGDVNDLLRCYMERISQTEMDELKKDISEAYDNNISLITDNTPRLGDVFALLARFVVIKDNRPIVRQRLLTVEFLKRAMNSGQLSGLLQSHV